MRLTTVNGDLLDQDVDAIVNAWNRNVIPWWLLIPQGVSGAIKRRAGREPFREVGRRGPMPLGSAVWTSAGQLPFVGIIHVAGINLLWRASESSIRDSIRHAVELAVDHGVARLATPIIGAGSGGLREEDAYRIIVDEAERIDAELVLTLVRFRRGDTTTQRA
ncbi:macro domain-containing protein [Enhygromyxa salina]|uniref:O-acetyl-ADP-ribose deacetylase n=1 Tax=Enhygromyxa salina TaxID=215803 RepID=A0A2S9YSF9_9BACT|nr:macro domain-containing protein [Enhygromyxa salina]PRQ08045.1 O-acetyl-ADP-ribose deacetylase [Enhygromyxa salina]